MTVDETGSTGASGVGPAALPGQPTEVVSLADFGAVDCEMPIAESRHVDSASLADPYRKAAKVAVEQGREREAGVYRLLADIAQLHFKPDDRGETYGPSIVMDGRRSMIPDDVRGDQSAVLAAVAPRLRNPGLRARLADIAWLNDRSLASSAQLAISSACEAVRLVMDGQAVFFLEEQRASSHAGAELLRRACQIAQATGWQQPEADELKSLVRSIAQTACDESDVGGSLNLGELALDYRIADSGVVAAQAERLTKGEALHPESARLLWELAARAQHYQGNHDESNRCLSNAAECYVTMAEAAGFRGMTAASWLMDAIRALRQVPGTRERRQELEAKLREAQASIPDEMGLVSTEIDLSEIVDQARKAVRGLTLAQAFGEFANLDRSPSPASLRQKAMEQASDNPLLAMIPMAVHDDEGKLITTSPGLMGSEDTAEIAVRHLIARDEAVRRQLSAMGAIEPARRLIMSEHPLGVRHFVPLARMSPFVPAGREQLFALGFARFFAGDLVDCNG